MPDQRPVIPARLKADAALDNVRGAILAGNSDAAERWSGTLANLAGSIHDLAELDDGD